LLALAAGIAGVVGTMAAIPDAAKFARDSWCWALACTAPAPSPKPRAPAQIKTEPQTKTQLPTKTQAPIKSPDPDNACYYDYMMFGSRANHIMGLTKLEPGRNEVFRLIMMDCNPVTSEFDLRRQGSGIWGLHLPDSSLYNDTLIFSVNFWMKRPTTGNASVNCVFESTKRRTVREFEGLLTCSDQGSNGVGASSKNERVTVTLFECDEICQKVVLPGELQNNGHGPQEWLKALEEAQHRDKIR